jgi:hypothetical protein
MHMQVVRGSQSGSSTNGMGHRIETTQLNFIQGIINLYSIGIISQVYSTPTVGAQLSLQILRFAAIKKLIVCLIQMEI